MSVSTKRAPRRRKARVYIICQPVVPQRADVFVGHCSGVSLSSRASGAAVSACRGVVAYRGYRSLAAVSNCPDKVAFPKIELGGFQGRKSRVYSQERYGSEGERCWKPSSARGQLGANRARSPAAARLAREQSPREGELTGSPSRRAILDLNVIVFRPGSGNRSDACTCAAVSDQRMGMVQNGRSEGGRDGTKRKYDTAGVSPKQRAL